VGTFAIELTKVSWGTLLLEGGVTVTSSDSMVPLTSWQIPALQWWLLQSSSVSQVFFGRGSSWALTAATVQDACASQSGTRHSRATHGWRVTGHPRWHWDN
jgi:hypothetical protein